MPYGMEVVKTTKPISEFTDAEFVAEYRRAVDDGDCAADFTLREWAEYGAQYAESMGPDSLAARAARWVRDNPEYTRPQVVEAYQVAISAIECGHFDDATIVAVCGRVAHMGRYVADVAHIVYRMEVERVGRVPKDGV